MAQQRLKFIRDASGSYSITTETDTQLINPAGPVVLDAGEDFRLIVRDDLSEAEVNDAITGLVTNVKDGQLLRNAIKL